MPLFSNALNASNRFLFGLLYFSHNTRSAAVRLPCMALLAALPAMSFSFYFLFLSLSPVPFVLKESSHRPFLFRTKIIWVFGTITLENRGNIQSNLKSRIPLKKNFGVSTAFYFGCWLIDHSKRVRSKRDIHPSPIKNSGLFLRLSTLQVREPRIPSAFRLFFFFGFGTSIWILFLLHEGLPWLEKCRCWNSFLRLWVQIQMFEDWQNLGSVR